MPSLKTQQDAATCCPDFLLRTPSDAEAQQAAEVFRALADPARVKLLSLIAAAPSAGVCVCDLWNAVGLSQSTVSHHLKVLLAAGLVTRHQKGTWAYYRVREESLRGLASALSTIGG